MSVEEKNSFKEQRGFLSSGVQSLGFRVQLFWAASRALSLVWSCYEEARTQT